MGSFEQQYKLLNDAQKKAVDTTEGPVLVVAGPGTGKTQLLSMRVANIMRKNDIQPGNILCLTFTDNAARNIRDRLSTIIGQPAYHVAMHTFHSFGSDIISQNPDYFTDRLMIQRVEELGRFELLKEIFETLPHDNPLSAKVGDDFIFIKDALNTISWLKQNALQPKELREILKANEKCIKETADILAETFESSPIAKNLPEYRKLQKVLAEKSSGVTIYGFPDYGSMAAEQLDHAIEISDPSGRFVPPVTEWRKNWCKKNNAGKYVFKDAGSNLRKMKAVADVYEDLLEVMSAQGLYDFDDMVIEAVHAVENNDELRFNLQERYQYILVDEFQDTNKAQLRLLTALGNNPVHEDRPNIMAVGDDDQAIYAFQGAEVSNMVAFLKMYREPVVIPLIENYRSDEDILNISQMISSQIGERLKSEITSTDKQLIAKKAFEQKELDHTQFPSELAQYEWIAGEIDKLIKKGASPEEIAVIAPRHKYLERLMPYLGNKKIPVAYERRENILESPIIAELISMSELIWALVERRQDDIDRLFSRVLGFDFWGLDSHELISISLECYDKRTRWLEVLMSSKNEKIKQITEWFVDLSRRANLEPMEYILDKLVGTSESDIVSEYDDFLLPSVARKNEFISPFRQYYFPTERYDHATDSYLTLLGQLSSLRQRLRQWQPHRTLYIKDFVDFCELHKRANLKIIDANPHTQTTKAVQVMTAYKAKGLEFETVFVINSQDEVWGPTAKSGGNRISMPRNLPIAPAGDSIDDKLRLFFVSLTRAKNSLRITSYSHSLENKLSPGLSFLMDSETADKPIHKLLEPKIVEKPAGVKASEILATDWAYRYRQVIAGKPALMEPVLKNYKLSVTHLNNFVDVKNAGPQYFLIHNLLRFPETISPSAAYGDAMHRTLQMAGVMKRKNGSVPEIQQILELFEDFIKRAHLPKTVLEYFQKRGENALKIYFKEREGGFLTNDRIEHNFNNEGVTIGEAALSGKIDRLRVSDENRAIVTDFKTGTPIENWNGRHEFEKIKLHKYKQQLMFYKLLVENSATFAGKIQVNKGELEFVEPDEEGKLVRNLVLDFDSKELEHFSRLIVAVWKRINSLDFPDISVYTQDLNGIRQFEEDLISND